MATTTQSYRDILASVAESLKPGGEIDTARMAEIDAGGKNLGAQLAGSAVSKGLGNVSMGIPTTVAKQVSSAKLKARSELMQSYLSVLTNLAGMAFQEQQAAASARNQQQIAQGPSMASQGLDVFGKPLRGSLAETQANYMNRQTQASSNPSSAAQPNLYAAGGYGGNVSSAPSLFGDVGGSTAPASVSSIQMVPLEGSTIYGSGGRAIGNYF
jgi:hypothetical protein